MDKEAPVKVQTADDAVEWLRGRLTDEPPKGQPKGPIPYHGVTAYVECPSCTIARGRPTGVPRRHARRHLLDHRRGLRTAS